MGNRYNPSVEEITKKCKVWLVIVYARMLQSSCCMKFCRGTMILVFLFFEENYTLLMFGTIEILLFLCVLRIDTSILYKTDEKGTIMKKKR